jgi:SAM-dependent methyltransferase
MMLRGATMDCDAIAPVYATAEHLTFGRALERCRVRYLEAAARRRAALVCGEGDGRFLAALLRAAPDIRVDYIDLSRGMLDRARRRVARLKNGALDRVEFFQADLRSWVPLRQYDLVATHFVLDCFTDAEASAVIGQIAAAANQDALWLLSEFRIPESGWRRLFGSSVVATLYAAFRVATGLKVDRLPRYREPLERAGFAPREIDHRYAGLLTAERWERR